MALQKKIAHTNTLSKVKSYLNEIDVFIILLIGGSGQGNHSAVVQLIHWLIENDFKQTINVYSNDEEDTSLFKSLLKNGNFEQEIELIANIHTDNKQLVLAPAGESKGVVQRILGHIKTVEAVVWQPLKWQHDIGAFIDGRWVDFGSHLFNTKSANPITHDLLTYDELKDWFAKERDDLKVMMCILDRLRRGELKTVIIYGLHYLDTPFQEMAMYGITETLKNIYKVPTICFCVNEVSFHLFKVIDPSESLIESFESVPHILNIGHLPAQILHSLAKLSVCWVGEGANTFNESTRLGVPFFSLASNEQTESRRLSPTKNDKHENLAIQLLKNVRNNLISDSLINHLDWTPHEEGSLSYFFLHHYFYEIDRPYFSSDVKYQDSKESSRIFRGCLLFLWGAFRAFIEEYTDTKDQFISFLELDFDFITLDQSTTGQNQTLIDDFIQSIRQLEFPKFGTEFDSHLSSYFHEQLSSLLSQPAIIELLKWEPGIDQISKFFNNQDLDIFYREQLPEYQNRRIREAPLMALNGYRKKSDLYKLSVRVKQLFDSITLDNVIQFNEYDNENFDCHKSKIDSLVNYYSSHKEINELSLTFYNQKFPQQIQSLDIRFYLYLYQQRFNLARKCDKREAAYIQFFKTLNQGLSRFHQAKKTFNQWFQKEFQRLK